MVDGEKVIKIEAKETARGLAILDYGKTAAAIRDDLSPAELAVFIEKNAAVAFWLPANCSANIYATQSEEVNEQGSLLSFRYEVGSSSSKCSEDLAKAMAVEIPWLLICGGELVIKFCPIGQIAMCVEGVPMCNPLL